MRGPAAEKDITPEIITKAKNERAKDVRTGGKDEDGEQIYRSIKASAVKATMVTLRSVINYAATAHGAAVRMFDWKTWIKKDKEEYDVRTITETEEEKIWPVLEEMDEDVAEFATFNLAHPKRVNELLIAPWPPRPDVAQHRHQGRLDPHPAEGPRDAEGRPD